MNIQQISNKFVAGYADPLSEIDPVLVMVQQAATRHQLFIESSHTVEQVDLGQKSSIDPFAGQRSIDINDVKVLPQQLTTRRQPLVVGVSGGADSICLIHTLARLADVWKLEIHIAHLNHNLRDEASTDAMFVANVAQKLAFPFHVATVAQGQLMESSSSLEGSAREVRYRFLTTIAKMITPPGQHPMVAVAHHADDQVETILMNLIRGGGLKGLSGMDWQTEWRDIRIVRPLLGIQRQEIIDFNHRNNLTWVEDATNQDLTMRRNRIRHQVIPILTELNPNLTETFSRTASTLTAELERITAWDQDIFTRVQPPQVDRESVPPRRIIFRLAEFMKLELATQRSIIRMALAKVADNQLRDIGFDMVEGIIESIRQDSALGVAHPIAQRMSWTIGKPDHAQDLLMSIHLDEALPFLPNHPLLNRTWKRRYGRIPIPHTGQLTCPYHWLLKSSLMAISDLPKSWKTTKGAWEAYLDADVVGGLFLTTPIPGAKFAPIGMKGKHQAIGDLFTNRKILKSFRNRWPIVISMPISGTNAMGSGQTAQAEGQALWVCGLQQADAAQITDSTENVLCLRWEKKS